MIKIGIICPSEIAFRRFLPALSKHKEFEYVGVAIASKEEWFGDNEKSVSNYKKIKEVELEKAERFRENYGGEVFESYSSMLTSGRIDAVYLPLPPALHYKWATIALDEGLHVFVEKPSSCSYEQTENMINHAKEKKLEIHENYMFIYHSQLEEINKVIKSGQIGEIRLIRIDFGFPMRASGDFRYIKTLGGGALLDCGGYTFKYANYILGGDANIVCANAGYKDGYEVEIFGSATLVNSKDEVVQTSFGMDNDYRCSIEVWGSLGTLRSGRVLTAPEGFRPTYEISKNGSVQVYDLPADDAFHKSISVFYDCIVNQNKREENYRNIIKQEDLVEQFALKSGLRGVICG